MQVMTPSNPRWEEFIEKLEGVDGCNFRQTDPDDINTFTWTCDNSSSRPIASAILRKMGNIDIGRSLDYSSENGGHCDCEIVFNVGQS